MDQREADRTIAASSAPGEWFFSKAERLLHFFPPRPLSEASPPVLSVHPTALELDGNTSHVELSGLQILHARGSGVSAVGVHGVTLRNCTVAAHALDGVTLLGTESAVLDSVVHDVGCAGIRAHGGDDMLLRPGNLRVESNEIFGTSQWKRTYSPGIHWGGVGNTYSHNHVHDLPHNCILGGAARPTF